MRIYQMQILLEVTRYFVQVEEDLLKVFFYEGKDPYQFNIAEPGHDVVGNGMVLVTQQQWEFDI